MLDLIRKLLGREYRFLNTISIDQAKLISNYRYLQLLSPKLQIAPVLKSNAYGHGIVEIGQIVDRLNPPFICVDSLHEAYRLQKAGIKTPILIMGYIDPENLRFKKLPFEYAVYSLNYLKAIHRYQPQAKIHLKVDTGMHRMGIKVSELDQFLKQLKKISDLKVEGLMSHLAMTHGPLFELQLKNFQLAQKKLKKHGIYVARSDLAASLAASEAILDSKVRAKIAKVSNLIRVGKALYGYSLTVDDPNLQPILTLATTIAQIKQLKKGEMIGYDSTFKAKKPMTMAVLPIGYFDGVDRRLSNCGLVKIASIYCPIVGRVSMNITTIDVSKVPEVRVGDEVIVYSPDPKDKNSISKTADICGTIPHEVLIHLASSTNRIVV